MSNRARNRYAVVVTHPVACIVVVQNLRTGRWRPVPERDLHVFGIVGAWRRNRYTDWLQKWHRTGGPSILPALRPARRAHL